MLHLLTRPQRLVTAEFYQTELGREPVREWLKTLTPTERQAIGDGLWEIRSHLGNRIARIFFCFVREKMILLHGFIKKSRVAPATDLILARDRKADLERRLRSSHLRQQT